MAYLKFSKHLIWKVFYSIFFVIINLGLYAQDKSLDFLKGSNRQGEPSIEETLKWLEDNLILKVRADGFKRDVAYQIQLEIDNIDGWRLFEIPCEIKPPYFEYSRAQNTMSFRIDNMGCYAGAYPLESATVTIFLDNMDPYSYVAADRNDVQRISLRSWNSKNRGIHQWTNQFYSDYELGYIVWDNFDDCSGKTIKTFRQLSFPLELKTEAMKDQIENAIGFLGRKCSAKDVECYDFGACFIANSKVSISTFDSKNIQSLSKGDRILSYDIKSNKVFETEVVTIEKVYHDKLIDLCFSDDTITCTKDHPFYIDGKGWSSVMPSETTRNYSNYSEVATIEVGDFFLMVDNGDLKAKKLMAIEKHGNEEGELTYAITELKEGNTYFVNGVLTGVEQLRQKASANTEKEDTLKD
jgi:hypothetical protein